MHTQTATFCRAHGVPILIAHSALSSPAHRERGRATPVHTSQASACGHVRERKGGPLRGRHLSSYLIKP